MESGESDISFAPRDKILLLLVGNAATPVILIYIYLPYYTHPLSAPLSIPSPGNGDKYLANDKKAARSSPREKTRNHFINGLENVFSQLFDDDRIGNQLFFLLLSFKLFYQLEKVDFVSLPLRLGRRRLVVYLYANQSVKAINIKRQDFFLTP